MTHVHEDLGALVLGALDPAEEERVRAHLADCPQCTEAHGELAGLPHLLDLAVVAGADQEEPLPPAIEERVLDRFARERPAPAKRFGGWRPRLALGVGGAFAGAAVAAVLLLAVFGFRSPAQRVPYQLALRPMAGAPASAGAKAGLRSVEGGTMVRLRVWNLPTKPGEVYEVLCSNKKWTASAGTFRTDAQGNAYVVLTTAAKRGHYDQIRVVRRSVKGGTETVAVLGARLA
jgi:Putative zinc-finger